MVGGCRYVGGRHGVYMLGIFFCNFSRIRYIG